MICDRQAQLLTIFYSFSFSWPIMDKVLQSFSIFVLQCGCEKSRIAVGECEHLRAVNRRHVYLRVSSIFRVVFLILLNRGLYENYM